MFDLCRAEWIKIVGNRRTLVLLLGVFPLGAGFIFFFAGLIAVADPSFHDTVAEYFTNWADLLLRAWVIPNQMLGRIFLVAFTALTFAGEYQWGTWKNITSRRQRAALVLVKFLVLSVLVLAAFTLTSVVMAVGGTAVSALSGLSIAPHFSLKQLMLILPEYFLSAAMAFLAFLITAIFAAFASIYSRSILGGCMAGIVLILAEAFLFLLPRRLADLLEVPSLLHLQRAIPIYNLENIRSWIQEGVASAMLESNFAASGLAAPADGALFSTAWVAAWIVLGISAVVLVFERQDITS